MTSQNSWNADFNDGKGELLVGNNTRPVVEPVGADGTFLQADSTQATGVKWASVSTPPMGSSFYAYKSASTANFTGNGVNQTIIFDTEDFDVGSNYNNVTGTFTAPIDGTYCFYASILYQTFVAANSTEHLFFLVNGATLYGDIGYQNPFVTQDTLNSSSTINTSALIDLVAGDTVVVRSSVVGPGNTVTLFGSANRNTAFMGFLAATTAASPANIAAFGARLTVTTGGVTGNGAIYTFGNNGGGTTTVDYDNGSNISFPGGNLNFTAPVSGVYHFGWQLLTGPFGAAMTSVGCSLLINATPHNGMVQNAFATASSAVPLNTAQELEVELVAGDVVTFLFQVTGGPADTVTILATNNSSYVYGHLVSQDQAASGVFGPGSATDRAIATWNGTSGALQYDNPTTRITAAGEMTNTGQPAFQAFVSAPILNVTGGGGGPPYEILFDTENFDQNSDYAPGTGRFTAPVSGVYAFYTSVSFTDIGASHLTGTLSINVNAGAEIARVFMSPFVVQVIGAGTTWSCSGLYYLNAGDFASVFIDVLGAALVIDVTTSTMFSGALLC